MRLRADRQGASGPGFNLLRLRSEFAVAGDCLYTSRLERLQRVGRFTEGPESKSPSRTLRIQRPDTWLRRPPLQDEAETLDSPEPSTPGP